MTTAPTTNASFTHPAPVAILGGMGPSAGLDLARLFLQACTTLLGEHHQSVRDQAYPAHWLAQMPVPDRSSALADPSAPQPLPGMCAALAQLASLGARYAAIACNTAHAWHAALQAHVPQIEILHIAHETAAHLRRHGQQRAALLATQGTYQNGLYEQALAQQGITCILPTEAERSTLMRGIYEGVKAADTALGTACFAQVAHALQTRHAGSSGPLPLIMGCTEIPLALPLAPEAAHWPLIDPAAILATALARRAYGLNGG